MVRTHALLSASAASRWLNCTPSAVLESKIKSKTSSYADEGTVAHALAELELKKYFGLITDLDYLSGLKDLEQTEFYDDAMADYVSEYVVFIVENYNQYKNPSIYLEQKLDLSGYVPDGFGTSDVNIVGEMNKVTVLEVIDLKYGKGVAVSADENKQMMLYGLGALNEFEFIANIDTVKMTVYQPRINNFSSYEISVKELIEWANTELKPKAEMAFEGRGELVAGEWCKFCKVKGTCRAFATAQLELTKLEFSELPDGDIIPMDKNFLTDEEISQVLLRSSQFRSWLSAVEEHALDQAINHQKKWPGLKLVEGRSNRKYTEEEKINDLLLKKGYTQDQITQSKLLPITKMEKFLGGTLFTQLVGKFVIKPTGSLTLVHVNDKRPEHNSIDAAKKDFS